MILQLGQHSSNTGWIHGVHHIVIHQNAGVISILMMYVWLKDLFIRDINFTLGGRKLDFSLLRNSYPVGCFIFESVCDDILRSYALFGEQWANNISIDIDPMKPPIRVYDIKQQVWCVYTKWNLLIIEV